MGPALATACLQTHLVKKRHTGQGGPSCNVPGVLPRREFGHKEGRAQRETVGRDTEKVALIGEGPGTDLPFRASLGTCPTNTPSSYF